MVGMNLLKQINSKHIKSRILPKECLAHMKSDLIYLSESENLNKFQKWIINKRYILEAPEFNISPKAIIIVAVKFKLVNIIFNYQGKNVADIFCVKRRGVKERLNRLFSKNGY